MTRRRLQRASLAALLLGASPPILAAAIQYALVSKSDGRIMVEIRLTCPHRYESHEPVTAAREVMISLARVGNCAESGAGGHDTARPAGREMASIEEVDYDARGSNAAVIQLHFRDPAVIEVRQGGDPRSVRITVTLEPGATAAAAPLPRAQTPSAAPPLTPEQQARIDARLRDLAAPAAPTRPGGDYAINLASSAGPPDAAGVPAGEAADRELYVVDTELEGQAWQQLRLGFFATEAEAEAVLAKLRARYPNAWVVRIGADERTRAHAFTTVAQAAVSPASPRPAGIAAGAPGERGAMMAEARAAFLDENFDRAALLYTGLLAEPRNAYSEEAQEFLGVAHDRQGQTAQAIADYRRYLADYPQGDGAARVRQRLAALTTARETPKSGLRAASRGGETGWDGFGSFSQYYRRDSADFAGQGMTTNASLLQTDGDFGLREHGERVDFSSRARLGYDYDLLKDPGVGGNRTRVYDLYADFYERDWSIGARIGRQTERDAGVLGRYDGAHLSYLVRPDIKLNVMGGFPVYLSSDSPDTSRVFYGMSVDLSGLLKRFDTSFFFNTQDVDGINDRQAIGAEVHYFDEARSVVGLVDYDTGFSTLTTLSIAGNWTFDGGLAVSASADYRRSPFPLTENALIGQGAGSVDELLQTLTEDQIRQLAIDRTGEMLTYALGASGPLSERWQFNADFAATQLAEGPASGGVAALPDSANQYFVDVNVVGSSLFTEGDVSIFGLRYGDTAMTSMYSAYVDSRFPLTSRLRLNPLLGVARREIAADGSSEWVLIPGLRLLYRFAGRYEIDLEGGGELGSRSGDETSDTTAYYIYMGYRADF